MKRISFFLVILCALILSVGLNSAQAQDGIVDIRTIGGLLGHDTVKTGVDIRFVIGWNNNTTYKMDCGNGWRVLSPDGAAWDSVTLDSCGPDVAGASKLATYFQTTCSFILFPGQPANGPDTVGFLGAGKYIGPVGNKHSTSLPAGYNDTVMAVHVYMSNDKDINAGKHICIDSSFFQPGGTWVWVDTFNVTPVNAHTPLWNGSPLGPAHVNGQGYCYVMYKVLNQRPVITDDGSCGGSYTAVTLTQGHCTAFTHTFKACDPEGDPITFAASLGTIDPNTGVWSASGLATGDYTVNVTASDAGGPGAAAAMLLHVTNAAPAIGGQCGATIATSTNSPTPATFTATDADACDPKIWTIISVVPAGPTATINGSGVVSFTSAASGDYVVTVGVSDGIVVTPTTCDVTFHVLEGSLNSVYIQKVEKVIQGQFWPVNVTLNSIDPSLALGGFDFLIAYDNSALSLQNATTGALYTNCKWEYFTYRFGANGNCSGGCPSGLVRVVGLAETNNGAAHPTCTTAGSITTPVVMFTLNFLVSNNRLYECQYVPIRFFWMDCGDNTLSSFDGSRLILEKTVWDYNGSQSQPYQLDSNLAGFPGYAGIPDSICGEFAILPPGKINPKRDIDFFDGGIDIICANDIDGRGDVNLNGLENEVADVVMFTNYFIHGLNAFGTHVQGSIAATDVNADGLTLSVADLVYLIRIVVGDALPYAGKVAPVAVTYKNDNGSLSVDQKMGAAFIVVEGNVKPTLLANNMQMGYEFDGTNTRILVYPQFEGVTSTQSFSGNFINVNGTIVSLEMATAEGAPVVAKQIPSNFALNQNYPNPFNPTTSVSFALPTASQYTLTIYNVTGQSVAEFTGAAEAGVKTIEWNASSNASGVYFYKLTAGSFTATKKMVLLK